LSTASSVTAGLAGGVPALAEVAMAGGSGAGAGAASDAGAEAAWASAGAGAVTAKVNAANVATANDARTRVVRDMAPPEGFGAAA
jgi:hypothetical protein